jgi:TonB family protein
MLPSLLFAIAIFVGTGQRSPTATIELAYGDARGDVAGWVLDAQAEIRRRWALPYEARRRVGHAAIAFTVDRSGQVTDTSVEIASEVPGFDDSAAGAIRAARLLPLPDDYPEERFTVTLVFWLRETPFDVFEGTRPLLETVSPVTDEEPIRVEPLFEEPGAAAADAPELGEPPAPAELESPPESEPAPFDLPEPRHIPERVFFTDGTSLEIHGLETRGELVILRRRDGRLQSVPRAFVDWERTRGEP